MSAFTDATRRLVPGWSGGVWIGAIRRAFDDAADGGGEGAGDASQRPGLGPLPPHYLVALWEPPDPARPVLPRWPAVAAIASPDSQAALLELVRHLPATARVWLADEAVDWALVAEIVRRTDRHLTLAHHVGLERFIEAERQAEAERIAAEYTDRDAGFEAFKRHLHLPDEQS